MTPRLKNAVFLPFGFVFHLLARFSPSRSTFVQLRVEEPSFPTQPPRLGSPSGDFGHNRKWNGFLERGILCAPLFHCERQSTPRLKTYGFLPIRLIFHFLSSFPRSAYLCTLLARQPRISAPNSLARGLVPLTLLGCESEWRFWA